MVAGRYSFGRPSVSGTFVWMDKGGKDFESIAVTENIWGNMELGYALERIGLVDWPDAVSDATLGAVYVDNHVLMHNFNTRLMVIKEGGNDLPWIPAVTLGTHFKWNHGLDDIDYQTGGLCGAPGGEHLIKAENDWWDIALTYVFNDHLTITGGYADLGNVLNHRENNSWTIQVKYEF